MFFQTTPPLIQWLEENHLIVPLELIEDTKVHTLFVDNNVLDKHFDIEKYSSNKEEIIQSTIKQLDEIYHFWMPEETFFYSVDGTRPVSRYQTLRCKKLKKAVQERMNRRFQYPDERTYENETSNQDPEIFDNAIRQYFTDLKADNEEHTERFIFSCEFTPGESEQKFFNYFRRWRNSTEYVPRQNHFILSNNLETVLYSLKFLNEKIFIIYTLNEKNYKIIDISKLRKYFLDKIPATRRNNIAEGRVIDDYIGLMLIVENKFIQRLKLFGNIFITYSSIFQAYNELNQNVRKPYNFLIEHDVFNVFALRIISIIMSQEENKKREEISRENEKREEEKKKKSANNLPSINLRGNSDIEHKPFVPPPNVRVNQLHFTSPPKPKPSSDAPKPPSSSFSQKSSPSSSSQTQQQQQENYTHFGSYSNSNSTFGQQQYDEHFDSFSSPNYSFGQQQYQIHPQFDSFSNTNYEFGGQRQQQQPKHVPSVERREKRNIIEFSLDINDQAQDLLRVFNYAFIYYTSGPPSWNYSYHFYNVPPLTKAVKLMVQEGRSYFDTDDNEVPDKLLEMLIVLPAYFIAGPWNIYKIKIPEFSDIAEKYWYLADKVKDVSAFDLKEIKDIYKEALEEMSDEEINKYNKTVDVDFILE